VVVVPYESVRDSEDTAKVYVCSGDVALERVVEKGRANDDGKTRILKGLSAGETIVLKGADRMYDGAKIWLQDDQNAGAESSDRNQNRG
jgi:multidrug efflux pump subunit AcrA (membrane-fusion protein)